MTDTEFLHKLDKIFEAIQEADIKGDILEKPIYKLFKLCRDYLRARTKLSKEKNNNPLNGVD